MIYEIISIDKKGHVECDTYYEVQAYNEATDIYRSFKYVTVTVLKFEYKTVRILVEDE